MSHFLIRNIIYVLYQLISGRRILPKLTKLKNSQWWSPTKIAELQQVHLQKLLHHAYETVPYYHHIFDAVGISPIDIRSIEELRQLPLLTKPIIQQHQEDILSTAYSPTQCIANHTGGSTGTPLQFYQDQHQRDWGSANKLRCNIWAGWDFGKRTLRLWGHPQDLKAAQTIRGKLRDFLLKEYTFDAFNFSINDMTNLVRYIKRKQPEVIVAYASVLTHFATYLENHHHTEDLPSLEGIISSTDILFPYQRALIERVFRTKVFNRYGCREVSIIAAECEEHQGMHINADRLIVEFIDENDQPVSSDRPGRVVITDLFNYAMPFIRYDIEDIAVPSTEKCACGRGLPLMKELIGRYADILTTPQGQFVSASALTTILSQISGLQECQLVQKTRDWLEVRVVCYPNYNKSSEATFRKHLVQFFGPEMQITFNYVEKIPITSSGKKRFSISEVESPPL
jgi:phenylacetate-CoA ligase